MLILFVVAHAAARQLENLPPLAALVASENFGFAQVSGELRSLHGPNCVFPIEDSKRTLFAQVHRSFNNFLEASTSCKNGPIVALGADGATSALEVLVLQLTNSAYKDKKIRSIVIVFKHPLKDIGGVAISSPSALSSYLRVYTSLRRAVCIDNLPSPPPAASIRPTIDYSTTRTPTPHHHLPNPPSPLHLQLDSLLPRPTRRCGDPHCPPQSVPWQVGRQSEAHRHRPARPLRRRQDFFGASHRRRCAWPAAESPHCLSIYSAPDGSVSR